MALYGALKRRLAAFLEIASPDHHLVGISDVIHRRDLAARKLFAALVGQHLQLELLTVRAALGAQPVEAVQAVMTHPSSDFLFGH
jgi:hypothetical protein